jgi:hypothetical protein
MQHCLRTGGLAHTHTHTHTELLCEACCGCVATAVRPDAHQLPRASIRWTRSPAPLGPGSPEGAHTHTPTLWAVLVGRAGPPHQVGKPFLCRRTKRPSISLMAHHQQQTVSASAGVAAAPPTKLLYSCIEGCASALLRPWGPTACCDDRAPLCLALQDLGCAHRRPAPMATSTGLAALGVSHGRLLASMSWR